MPREKRPNHLINEKSPYLLQHAYNPVDWYPWSEEAFSFARRDDKPIFLSVGYSTCHWCHVMERESFENDAIAEVLNRHFISIKVDREERPDVDKVYMTALQAMGQGGGWPMSMFLTPDLRPFYGGTYFPPESRLGQRGFLDILSRVHEAWTKERNRVGESADAIAAFLKEAAETPVAASAAGREALDLCFQQLRDTFDSHFGGFGGGPKFPRPVVYGFLLRYHALTGETVAQEMVERTLQKMSVGGIYDHIGGGFHRYAVDGEWRVPHFEKMLYDQAQLAAAFLDLYQVTRDQYYSSVAREILDYVLRDLRSEEGGFFSAEDADSPRPEDPAESGEGAFYLWTRQEILTILGTGGEPDDGEIFCEYFGVEPGGNAPVDPHHEFTGRNILYVARPVEAVARKHRLSDDRIRMSLISSKKKLLESRSHRPRPLRDEKILASWNGLMISALASASAILDEPRYRDAAVRAADFVLAALFDPADGLLLRRYCSGESGMEGQLDDYAFLAGGLIDLYEASGDIRYLRQAIVLTESQIRHFWDEVNGGFYESSGKDASILVRLKEQYDGAEPTGNAVSAMNLLRLAEMTDNHDWHGKAEKTLAAFSAMLRKQPVVMPHMASALARSLSSPGQIVLAGKQSDPAFRGLLAEVHSRYLPDKILLFADGAEGQRALAKYLPFIENVSQIDGKAAAYVCEHYACRVPTTDVATFREQLENMRGTASGMNS